MKFKIKLARKNYKRTIYQRVIEEHSSWEDVEKLVLKFNSDKSSNIFCKEVTDVAKRFTKCYDYKSYITVKPVLKAKPKTSFGNPFTTIYAIPKVEAEY